ncbi:DUF397 domain-containing protein [Catellatospora bangladeshensis]|uniref:DUF397 domain-containing protein n=1 Tax=Catellatospora bangladeshensis TaxID=310355 RepID=A0A8J3NLI0_9ACTN|nr:DUF397 domain-containing protein [Catellatospora bangladeshensis]GIF85062.1 hypothetical protein Cba03nite_64110 [Catellatospora bangladeshensis]
MTSVQAATWRKSSRCDSVTCVEVAVFPGAVGLRDSTDPLQHLMLSPESFQALIEGVKAGEFDLA